MSHRSFASRLALLLPLLAAGAAAGCEPSVSPQFTVGEPGAVEGLLYFDADEDAVFDPSDGDYALSGVELEIRVRGDTLVLAGGTVTSDASGRFTLPSLPAGTHDAYVNPATLPAGVVLCANPLPITVEPGVTRFYTLQTRGGCLVLIEAAEASTPGTNVVIRGIVTSAPGMMRNDYTYIQDASGGIRVFGSSLFGQGIEVGDRLEVSGTISLFNEDLQLTNPTIRALTPDFGSVTPRATTTGAIAAIQDKEKDPLQGQLVKLTAAKLTATFGANGVNNRNAFIDDGTGTIQIRFESGVYGSAAELPANYTVGKCYDITGLVGNFNNAGQIFPRQRSDVVEVPCT